MVADAQHERHVVVDEQHARPGRRRWPGSARRATRSRCCRGRPPARRAGAAAGSAAQARAIETSWRSPWLRSPAGRSAQRGDARRGRGRAATAACRSPRLRRERGDADVLLDAQVVVELERLERPGHAARAPGRGAPCRRGRCPTSVDRAGGPGEAGDGVDHAGLAGAVGPDEPDDAPGRHLERDVVDGDHAAVADGEVLRRRAAPSPATTVQAPSGAGTATASALRVGRASPPEPAGGDPLGERVPDRGEALRVADQRDDEARRR